MASSMLAAATLPLASSVSPTRLPSLPSSDSSAIANLPPSFPPLRRSVSPSTSGPDSVFLQRTKTSMPSNLASPPSLAPAAPVATGAVACGSSPISLQIKSGVSLPPSSWVDIAKSNGLCPTLNFYPPQSFDGDIVSISPPAEVIQQSEEIWGATLVGYFHDSPLHYLAVNNIARKIWARFGLCHVAGNENGFFFFRFASEKQLGLCLSNGPWTFGKHPLILKRWVPGMELSKDSLQTYPVWITLSNIPIEFWTPLGLSWIASGVGNAVEEQVRERFSSFSLVFDFQNLKIDPAVSA